MSRWSFLFACAAAVALVVAVYANSLDNSFHFDDSHVIETNLYIRSLDNVPRFFTDAHAFSSLPPNSTYRPLVTLSLAIDYAIGHGLHPRAFHVTQIVLLLITGALLLMLFVSLTGSRAIALFCATLFCLHTANTETMNLISARSELLSAIGLLGSFLLFIHSRVARRTLLYLVPLVIGALAKAPVVVFAPLLYVYLRLFEKQPPRRALREIAAPLLLGIALLVFLNKMNAPEWTSGGGSRWHYLITQPFIWLHYFRLFFLPVGLNADTDWTTFAHWYDTRAFAGYAFVALLIVAIRRFRNEPPIAFGLTWFAIALLPTSSIFPLAEVANEHRVFFAFMGLVLAVVWWIHDRLPRNALIAGACVVLLAHAVGTQARNRIWKSEESLWTDVVAKSPGNGRAWMNFGLTQMAKGQYTDAKASFERAAALVPTYSTLEINRGIVEGAIGDEAAAERHFKRALQLNADANAHFFYGRWLVQHGRGPEARVHFDEATRLSPAFADAQSLRTFLYAALGASNAGPHWPDYQSAFDAGLAEMRSNDWLDAACANRGALAHDPLSADAWNNLGWSLAQLGFRTEAAQAYEEALAIQPDHERARNNLALLIR